MKILSIDLRRNTASLIPETTDDLWLLSRIIKAGDEVRAKTARKEIIYRDSQFIEGEKVPMILTIRAEKSSIKEGGLRVLGVIVQGPAHVRLGAHHSIDIEIGKKVEIRHAWKSHELERIKKAGKRPELTMLLLDREGAELFSITEQGIKVVGRLAYKKKEKEERDEWYARLVQWIEEKKSVIIGGPGFERENLLNWIRAKRPDIANRVWSEHCSDVSIAGVKEIIRKSGNRLLREMRIAKETELIENLLAEIKKDGLVVYGRAETEMALKAGAVRMLLISEAKLSESEELLDMAEASRAEIEIISTGHEAGDIFLGLGGIGAFLRFKWT
ncbi:MAG: mRNA surveillance protein pelota [Candidatus Aenigmatarchaeota archaeon]